MAVQTFRCYVSTDVTFQCIDINRCVLWKRTTKIKQALKRKGGYLWWPPCCGWQRLCLLFLEGQPYPRPAIVVVGMGPIFSVTETRYSTSEQLMTMFSAMALFCSIPVILICYDPLLESTYCFFHLVNNKCGFSSLPCMLLLFGWLPCQRSDMTLVEVSQRAYNHLCVRDLWLAVYSWKLCKPDIVPVYFLLNKLVWVWVWVRVTKLCQYVIKSCLYQSRCLHLA